MRRLVCRLVSEVLLAGMAFAASEARGQSADEPETPNEVSKEDLVRNDKQDEQQEGGRSCVG
jgi:hypothetical protein